jgi:hypothetical protein
MTRMTVVTPSYAPDFELCVDLNRSVLQFAPDCVEHHILVPRSDFSLFARLAGRRTHVRCREDLLPGSFVRLPLTRFLLNLRWPLLPVRGWIEQQIVKLAAASTCTADVVLLVDSDVQFVRSFDAATFVRDGAVRFYRLPNGVDRQLPKHVQWHECARRLLGLPPAPPPYSDYISSMVSCDPAVVRRMLARVETTTGLPWISAISRQIDFSEWTLYGVFVDEFAEPPISAFVSEQPLCLGDWSTAFSKERAEEFLANIASTDVAAMISSKSGTSLAVRRAAFDDWRSRWHHSASLAATFFTQLAQL